MNWKVDENKELPVGVIEDTEDGFGICTLDGGGTASREGLEKTARLIAAAPDLLAACVELASIFPEESMSEMDAVDFKDRASRIWTAALEAKIAITKATQ